MGLLGAHFGRHVLYAVGDMAHTEGVSSEVAESFKLGLPVFCELTGNILYSYLTGHLGSCAFEEANTPLIMFLLWLLKREK